MSTRSTAQVLKRVKPNSTNPPTGVAAGEAASPTLEESNKEVVRRYVEALGHLKRPQALEGDTKQMYAGGGHFLWAS